MTPQEREAVERFLTERPLAAVLAALNGQGEETRLVGGAVRNLLLGEPVGDIDLATTATPDETARRGEAAGFKVVPTGIAHGTVTLVRGGTGFEVTSLRRDVETDGRHAVVAFGRDFGEDARRRDFTMNALYLDASGALHDPCGGMPDLAARRVRFIGDAGARIREDYLRILRFFRFHAQYGAGEPDRVGFEACIAGRAGLGGLSRERVRAEMLKLLVAPRAPASVTAMLAGGLLLPVLGCVPQVARFAAVAQEPGDGVYPAFRLAALAVSTREDAARLREGLRLSNAEADRIERIALALEGMSGRLALPSLADARRLAHRVGADAVAGAMVLSNATAEPARQEETRALIAGLGRTPPFLPTGKDLLAVGVRPGPIVGSTLAAAREAWIEAGCPEGREAQMELLRDVIPGERSETRDPS